MSKEELHTLVEALPDESVEAATVLLERAQDPVVAKLDAAPDDDEPFTHEERQAVQTAMHEPAVPWEQAEAELRAD